MRIRDKEKQVRRMRRDIRPENPTSNHMFGFFCELKEAHSELIPLGRKKDPWQAVHAWLETEERKIKKTSSAESVGKLRARNHVTRCKENRYDNGNAVGSPDRFELGLFSAKQFGRMLKFGA